MSNNDLSLTHLLNPAPGKIQLVVGFDQDLNSRVLRKLIQLQFSLNKSVLVLNCGSDRRADFCDNRMQLSSISTTTEAREKITDFVKDHVDPIIIFDSFECINNGMEARWKSARLLQNIGKELNFPTLIFMTLLMPKPHRIYPNLVITPTVADEIPTLAYIRYQGNLDDVYDGVYYARCIDRENEIVTIEILKSRMASFGTCRWNLNESR